MEKLEHQFNATFCAISLMFVALTFAILFVMSGRGEAADLCASYELKGPMIGPITNETCIPTTDLLPQDLGASPHASIDPVFVGVGVRVPRP